MHRVDRIGVISPFPRREETQRGLMIPTRPGLKPAWGLGLSEPRPMPTWAAVELTPGEAVASVSQGGLPGRSRSSACVRLARFPGLCSGRLCLSPSGAGPQGRWSQGTPVPPRPPAPSPAPRGSTRSTRSPSAPLAPCSTLPRATLSASGSSAGQRGSEGWRAWCGGGEAPPSLGAGIWTRA